MKRQFVFIAVFLWGVSFLVARDADVLSRTEQILYGISAKDMASDSVPKVEIGGRLKVNDMPEGSGKQVVADNVGNFYTSSLMMPPPGRDSLTYTIIAGLGPPFPTGITRNLQAFNVGGTPPDFTDPGLICSFSKKRDSASAGWLSLLVEPLANTDDIVIEVKIYESGASDFYLAYKLKNISVLSFAHGTPDGNEGNLENYQVLARIFGIWDKVDGGSFAYDSVNDMAIGYVTF